MEAIHPRVRVVRKRCARKTHPCPQCGKLGRRKDTHTRRIRDIAFGEIAIIELTVGEYRADCSCCKTFRSQVNGVEPRADSLHEKPQGLRPTPVAHQFPPPRPLPRPPHPPTTRSRPRSRPARRNRPAGARSPVSTPLTPNHFTPNWLRSIDR